MPPGPGEADDDAPRYLRLRMRPLSAGALQPVRGTGRSHIVAAVALGCLAVALLVLAPLVWFLSIFGDPYPLALVERRPDGLHAQLRAYTGVPIFAVEVTPDSGDPIPFWVATRQGDDGANSVRLFDTQPGFDTTATGSQERTPYVVTVNRGRPTESEVVVDELALGTGEVEFGGEPVSRAEYDSLRNSDFGCPVR